MSLLRIREVWWLFLPVVLFVLLRFPLVIHQPGGQDEQVFAVPGWTVSREGIPRVPYLPTRRKETFYENADKCLMALPPGLFYVQAPFFWMMPAGYPAGRMPLFLGGIASLIVAACFVRRFGGGWTSAVLAATMLALSRPLMFTGILARPDLLCMLCGWFALLVMLHMNEDSNWKSFVVAGALCGLGGLFHPFALVFCLQCGVWTLLKRATWIERAKHLLVLGLSALVVLSLWLPLIVSFPHEFRSQFFSNVLDRAGPGLPSRLLYPLPSLTHHAHLIWEFFGPVQSVLMATGLVVGGFSIFAQRHPERVRLTSLVLSSIYLTATVAGTHPTKGYWVYATLLVIVMISLSLESLRGLGRRPRTASFCYATLSILLICSFLPGSGIKSAWVYWNHWGDPKFHAGNFIKQTLNDFPEEGLFLADSPYVFDIYLLGRNTQLCQQRELFWGTEPIAYRYLLVAGEAIQDGWPEQYDAHFDRRIGSRESPQSCFVDVYLPPDGSERVFR